MNSVIFLITALLVKHFVVDFLIQTPYMYLNKGKFLHPGGLLHSALHAYITSWILIFAIKFSASSMGGLIWISIFISEFLIHYFVDLGKVQINNKYGWKADTSEKYWWLLGFDQLLHNLTYVAIAYVFLQFL